MAVAAYPATILITAQPSIAMPADQATSTTDSQTYTLTNATYRYLDPATPVVVQAKFDEVQLLTVTGSPAGGTFTLTFGAQTTAELSTGMTRLAPVQTTLASSRKHRAQAMRW